MGDEAAPLLHVLATPDEPQSLIAASVLVEVGTVFESTSRLHDEDSAKQRHVVMAFGDARRRGGWFDHYRTAS